MLRSRPLAVSAFCLALAVLAGCDSSSSGSPFAPTAEGAYKGLELAQGSYFIQSDYDDQYSYRQFFIVRPGGEWEFAEFGLDSQDRIVQLTRQIGVYKMDSTHLTLQVTHGGALHGKAPLTDAPIASFPFKPTTAPSATFRIRGLESNRFGAENLFVGVDGGTPLKNATCPASSRPRPRCPAFSSRRCSRSPIPWI